MKTRFFIFVGVAFLIVVLIGAYAASPKTPVAPKTTPTPTSLVTPTPPPITLSFKVNAGAGVNTVIVTNQNTGATITLTASDLPATYNCKNGDTLTFRVTANTGYTFNAWIFGDGTFQSRNPYTIKTSASFVIEPKFLMVAP